MTELFNSYLLSSHTTMNKMHFCLHFNSARQQWTEGWRSTEEGVPIGLRGLRREYHISGDSISRGHWQSFPPLRESVEGSNVFSAIFLSQLLPRKWIMVFLGLHWCHTNNVLCPYLPGSLSGKEGANPQQKQSPHQGTGPSEWGYESPGAPPPANGVPCQQRTWRSILLYTVHGIHKTAA